MPSTLADRPIRFQVMRLTLPEPIAASYGAALVELGAGAVEEREGSHPGLTCLLISLPESEPIAPWQELAGKLYAAFAEELSLPDGLFHLTTENVECDYHAPWLSRLTQVRLTPDLVVAPRTDETPVPEGAERLVYEPHPCFGDGTHPTTRMAAAAVATHCRNHPACSVLDVGTGTGLLSLVAARRGAGCILGIDIDPDAIMVATHNATLNAAACEFSSTPLESLAQTYQLVVANLEPRLQLELAEGLGPRVAPGGTLLLTGFLTAQTSSIAAPLLNAGFVTEETVEEEGYALLRLRRP
jgi:ribosomal protein L11 methyltransferase